MKKIISILIISGCVILIALYTKRNLYNPKSASNNIAKEAARLQDTTNLKTGDIIFQTSLSQQSKAIQLATHSEYSIAVSSTKMATITLCMKRLSPLN